MKTRTLSKRTIYYYRYKNYYFRKIKDLDNYFLLNDIIYHFNEKRIDLNFNK